MASTDNTKKSLAEQRYEMYLDMDRRHAANMRKAGLPERPEPEECMDELLVEAGEMTHEDLDVFGVCGAMVRLKSYKKALAAYPKITKDYFEKNVVRVMEYSSWDEFVQKHAQWLDA